jgi:hypothetical protein
MKRTETPDMSPAAIDQRLRDVSQLFKLGMSIQSARKLGKAHSSTPKWKSQVNPDGAGRRRTDQDS